MDDVQVVVVVVPQGRELIQGGGLAEDGCQVWGVELSWTAAAAAFDRAWTANRSVWARSVESGIAARALPGEALCGRPAWRGRVSLWASVMAWSVERARLHSGRTAYRASRMHTRDAIHATHQLTRRSSLQAPARVPEACLSRNVRSTLSVRIVQRGRYIGRRDTGSTSWRVGSVLHRFVGFLVGEMGDAGAMQSRPSR
jgi:hypothetical protein